MKSSSNLNRSNGLGSRTIRVANQDEIITGDFPNKVFAPQTIIGTAFAGNGGLAVAPRGDVRKNVPYRDRSLGEGDQAADRNSRLRILVRSSTRFILGISSRSTAA
jgi:hypothetical protein